MIDFLVWICDGLKPHDEDKRRRANCKEFILLSFMQIQRQGQLSVQLSIQTENEEKLLYRLQSSIIKPRPP